MKVIIYVLALMTATASATEMNIRARGSENLSDVFFSQTATSAATTGYSIRVNLSCFSTNLRYVANPISPTGVIRMNIGIGPNSNPEKTGGGDFAIWFPGWMVQKRGTSLDRSDILNLTDTKDPKKAIVSGAQNSLLVRPPSTAERGLDKPPYSRRDTMGLLKYINFEQDIQAKGSCWGAPAQSRNDLFFLPGWLNFLKPQASQAGGSSYADPNNSVVNPTVQGGGKDTGFGQPTCSSKLPGWDLNASLSNGFISSAQRTALETMYKQFMGHDGPLNAEWRSSWSSDFSTLVIDATFPGELQFCGGFFSPLMLFFDQRRPRFTARTDFKIHPLSQSVYWPEPNAPGYILALDVNGNGRIDDWNEIFGADGGQANGFEKLRRWDENRDGVIDSRDPVFSRLLLWRDRTGTGHSRVRDLHALPSMGVTSVSLKYEYKSQESVADRARLREKGTFTFQREGKERRGEVIDVWLSN